MTRADEGRYTCFTVNDRGKANSTGSLLVTGKFQLMNSMNVINNSFYVGIVGVALTDVSLRWQSFLSLSVPPNTPDLQMSTVVELWPSEQSDSVQATGHSPRADVRGDCFRSDVMRQGRSPHTVQ